MAVRPHEFHPAVVHFPIALLPLAVATDLLGRATGRRALREAGRHLMPLAAVSAAAAAFTGVVAQHSVEAAGPAAAALRKHRTANLTVAGLATVLAAWRWRRRTPSSAYLALGLGSVGLLAYTAHLGTRMVYRYGVGVDSVGGVAASGSPRPSRAAAAARTAAGDMLRGLPNVIARAAHCGTATAPTPTRTVDFTARRLGEGPLGSGRHR